MSTTCDLFIADLSEGIFLVTPITPAGEVWLDENVSDDSLWRDGDVHVKRDDLFPILLAAQAAGLKIEALKIEMVSQEDVKRRLS